MINKLNPKIFYEGSFADEKIYNVVLDLKLKKLQFMIERGITEDENNNSVCYKNIKISINNWSNFTATQLNPETSKETFIDTSIADFIDELLIYSVDNNKFTLEGFGRNSLRWHKYIFINPTVTINGEIDESYSSDDG